MAVDVAVAAVDDGDVVVAAERGLWRFEELLQRCVSP
jgi:hypothetical protein